MALGEGGFAADTAPAGALVALPDGRGGWALGETMVEARAGAGKVQGRRTPVESPMPLTFPEGDWAVRLRTSWVDPAYLETDASWCEPVVNRPPRWPTVVLSVASSCRRCPRLPGGWPTSRADR